MQAFLFLTYLYTSKLQELQDKIQTIKNLIKESRIEFNIFEKAKDAVVKFHKTNQLFENFEISEVESYRSKFKMAINETKTINEGLEKFIQLGNVLGSLSSITWAQNNIHWLKMFIDDEGKIISLLASNETDEYEKFYEILTFDINQPESAEKFAEVKKTFDKILYKREKYIKIHEWVCKKINKMIGDFLILTSENIFDEGILMTIRKDNNSNFIIFETLLAHLTEVVNETQKIATQSCESPEPLNLERHFEVIISKKIVLEINKMFFIDEQTNLQTETPAKIHAKYLPDIKLVELFQAERSKLSNLLNQYSDNDSIFFENISRDYEKFVSLHHWFDEKFVNSLIVNSDELDKLEDKSDEKFEDLINIIKTKGIKSKKFRLALSRTKNFVTQKRDVYYRHKFELIMQFHLQICISDYLEKEIAKNIENMYVSTSEQAKKFSNHFYKKLESIKIIRNVLGFSYWCFSDSGEIKWFFAWDNFSKLEFLVEVGDKILNQDKRGKKRKLNT